MEEEIINLTDLHQIQVGMYLRPNPNYSQFLTAFIDESESNRYIITAVDIDAYQVFTFIREDRKLNVLGRLEYYGTGDVSYFNQAYIFYRFIEPVKIIPGDRLAFIEE